MFEAITNSLNSFVLLQPAMKAHSAVNQTVMKAIEVMVNSPKCGMVTDIDLNEAARRPAIDADIHLSAIPIRGQ
ncbi:MAG: hypothetical protein AAGA61_01100 [Pseudomonadota bacterium]